MLPKRDFTHVIMTRFNMPTPGVESQIRGRPGWLEGRFDLFERYCLPSIAAQTRQDFHWIIYFDIETPQPFRDRIEACRAVFPFTPYYTDYFTAAGWPRSFAETYPDHTPWLLTTRFDSDDALSVDYVERLHAAVAAEAPTRTCAFNFTNGTVLCNGRVYALRHISNAFASRFEAWNDETKTAMAIRHMELDKAGPVLQIGGPSAWLQVIHDTNVSNKIRGRRVSPETVTDRFPAQVLGKLRPSHGFEITLENLVLTPLRDGRDTLVARLRGHKKVSS